MLETERKKTLISALDILNNNIKISTNLDSLLSAVKPIGRRRDSNLYLVDVKADTYPDGILIKIASNRKRRSRWDPLEEAARLDKLSMVGPKANMFSYLSAIYASKNPHFIALPYFPSSSLRTLVGSLQKNILKSAASRNTIECFYGTGKWLGMLYNLSPRKPVISSSTHTRRFIQERISELGKYSRVMELDNLSTYIDSIYENQLKALEIHPEYFHGDFNLDNVLVHVDGRICLVDPEPIRIGLFADFLHFRQSMIILTNRSFESRWPSRLEKYSQSFCDGFAGEYEECLAVGHVYLLFVLKKVSQYYKQGYKNPINITPRGLIYWYDQLKLMRYWVNWLNRLPEDPGKLWSYIRSTL